MVCVYLTDCDYCGVPTRSIGLRLNVFVFRVSVRRTKLRTTRKIRENGIRKKVQVFINRERISSITRSPNCSRKYPLRRGRSSRDIKRTSEFIRKSVFFFFVGQRKNLFAVRQERWGERRFFVLLKITRNNNAFVRFSSTRRRRRRVLHTRLTAINDPLRLYEISFEHFFFHPSRIVLPLAFLLQAFAKTDFKICYIEFWHVSVFTVVSAIDDAPADTEYELDIFLRITYGHNTYSRNLFI